MKPFAIVLAGLLFSTLGIAETDCRTECTKNGGNCIQLGIRSRASALHLNEILNSAHPAVSLPWSPSKCKRNIDNQKNIVLDTGEDCVEFMDPFPGRPADHNNGSRTSITSDLNATSSQENGEITVRFQEHNAPDFSFIVNGNKHNGGKVELLSHVPDVGGTGYPRLLIQTTETCFSID